MLCKKKMWPACLIAVALLTMNSVTTAVAGPREQAKRIHDRIAGVPPSAAMLNAMEADVAANDVAAAANRAMNNDAFYSVTLKNLATPWTNRDRTVFAPLNDYTATVIGMIRDDIDFRQLLYADILYVGAVSLNLTPYAMTNNTHYEELETSGASLLTGLVQTTQSTEMAIPSAATAGVMTTRGAASAFFYAGTNRAMLRFTLLNHLCNDLEQVKDTTRAPDRIRQDVSRSPGGDSRIFLNACVGCHSGMDPLAQAFAYYEYDQTLGRLVYNDVGMLDPITGTRVQAKYHINSDNFKYGYVTTNDQWDNYWRAGANGYLGWDSGLTGSGSGAKSMGMELAHSTAFAQCQVKKVFKTVCLRDPVDATDRTQLSNMVTSFRNNGYGMKRVFAEAADYCKGS